MKYAPQSDYLDNLLVEMDLMGLNDNGGTDKATDHSYTGMYESKQLHQMRSTAYARHRPMGPLLPTNHLPDQHTCPR